MKFAAMLLVGTALLSSQDDSKGLEKQFRSAWKEARAGHVDKAKSLLESFRMPHAWFEHNFPAGDSAAMEKQYSDQFETFRNQTVDFPMGKFFVSRGMPPEQLRALDVEVSRAELPKISESQPPHALAVPPAPEYFEFQDTLNGKKLSSWADEFVYIDGAFRFYGRGAYPFWNPANFHPADLCAKPGDATGGKLLQKVMPEYPVLAIEAGLEGTVGLMLKIGPDGSVTEAVTTGGPQPLQDAVKAVVMKWKFTPFMNCGKAVEGRVMEHVKFKLSDRSVG